MTKRKGTTTKKSTTKKAAPKNAAKPDHKIELTEKMIDRLNAYDRDLRSLQQQAAGIQQSKNSLLEGILFGKGIEGARNIKFADDGKTIEIFL